MTSRVSKPDVLDPSECLEKVVDYLGGSTRSGQVQMVTAVAETLSAGHPLFVQAGTGTGKSLAYLVPALLWAVREQKRVVISTATLALQRQIFTTDLPLVMAALKQFLPEQPRVALFKGRANYLCMHKLAGGYPDDESLPVVTELSQTGKDVKRLHQWANETTTGDRDDLVPGVSGLAWQQVSVNGRNCLDIKCPDYHECFVTAAREDAATAHVVVTNHAVLGLQASSHDLLGDYDALIIDEAHELEARVTSSGTRDLTVAKILRAVSQIARAGVVADTLSSIATQFEGCLSGLEVGRLIAPPGELSAVLVAMRGSLRQLQTDLIAHEKDNPAPVKVGQGACAEILDCIDVLLDAWDSHVVYVGATETDRGAAEPERLVAAPLNVAGFIGQKLVGDRPAVFTSATLTTGGSFGTIKRRCGLPDGSELNVGTPFSYQKQGILYLARHLPPPGTATGFLDAAGHELVELIRAAGGRTLGLFSSLRAAQAAREVVSAELELPVFCQGDDQLPTLINYFKDDPESSLFGTQSLWQGIDVPGDAVTLVVIDRIPFPRPDDPISQARMDLVKQRGGNGFMEIAANQAAILLAQGVGRLIRRTDDRGVVAILDSRIATARYGTFLLKSIPELWRTEKLEVALAALARLRQQISESTN